MNSSQVYNYPVANLAGPVTLESHTYVDIYVENHVCARTPRFGLNELYTQA